MRACSASPRLDARAPPRTARPARTLRAPGRISAAAPRTDPAAADPLARPGGPVPGFDALGSPFRLAILGDLHLDEATRPAFDEAAAQLRGLLLDGVPGESSSTSTTTTTSGGSNVPGAAPAAPRLLQLGDLGASSFDPGSPACFAAARTFLDGGVGVPRALVTGNHDLECPAFDLPGDEEGSRSDAANLAAWRAAFAQPHSWAARLGPARVLGVSTSTWRSNAASVHEVRVADACLDWLEAELASTPATTPVIIASHAPPAGCGLRVVQDVHVRNRCAYLNHAAPATAARFVGLVEKHANIALWFSGHYHLSHQYPTSISVVNGCAFVQVGVIGPKATRDGYRQSRLLVGDDAGFRLYSVDHGAGGTARLDLARAWGDRGPPAPRPVPRAERLDAGAAGGWLTSEVECEMPDGGGGESSSDDEGGGGPPPALVRRASPVTWLAAGGDALLAFQAMGGSVVEYSIALRSPTGIVLEGLPPWTDLVLVGADGADLPPDAHDPARAVAVEARARAGGAVLARAERNAAGTFYQTFQVNKWRKKKREAREAVEARAAVGVEG